MPFFFFYAEKRYKNPFGQKNDRKRLYFLQMKMFFVIFLYKFHHSDRFEPKAPANSQHLVFDQP